MAASLHFYTQVLDFQLKYSGTTAEEPVVDVIHGDAEIMLCTIDGTPKIPVYIRVNDVDSLFKKYVERGLDASHKKNSPVHQTPIDQTWGMREFYADDPDGNTIRFGQAID